MQLNEIWFYIWNTPYIEAHILKDMRVIATITQKIIGADNEEVEIVYKRKYGWIILPNIAFVKRNKFIMFLDLENCIPLMEEKKIIVEGDLFITEKTITVLKESGIEIKDFITDKSGRGKMFKGAVMPPTLFHQIISAHFLRETLKNPSDSWEAKKWIVIAIVLGIVVIGVTYLLTGKISPLG